ncbi:hypothetical protein Dfri01_21150 [Dyadobacter frigoris]|nr:hypothetical protein Dfri01_21150 [Dyadobacter frigoris]
MTACIVAINAFQGYWLWTNYLLNRQRFEQTVQDALFQVLEGRQIAHAKGVVSRELGKRNLNQNRIYIRKYHVTGNEGSRIIFDRRSDSVKMSGDRKTAIGKKIIYNFGDDSRTEKITVEPPDTMANRISKLLLMDWSENGSTNLAKIDTAYRFELKRRSVEATFTLDTLRITPEKSGDDILVFDNRNMKSGADGKLQTLPVPVNPVNNVFVQATFLNPSFYVLQRMAWLLAASVFLLILTTGCFVFMLNTILKQKKISEIKNDFINNMTHELKTPIATVSAAVDALLNFGVLTDAQKTQTYLMISETNLQRLSDMVEKVLNLAVHENHELKLNREPVYPAELISEVLSNHKLNTTKQVEFKIGVPAKTVVSVDKVHFGNILSNLIENAINYSYDKVTIAIEYRSEPDGWQLTVSDNGIGIPKSYHSAIFDRFFRVPTGNLHKVKGFGLGLAYVRQVMQGHGGSVAVFSEPEKGSTFILKF